MKRIEYRFISENNKRKVKWISVLDRIGYLMLNYNKINLDLTTTKSVAILQLAHIGDFVLTLPMIKVLHDVLKMKTTCVVNTVNYSLANKCKYIDDVIQADAPYFTRSIKKSGYLKFMKQLRSLDSDIIFDLRGDFRNVITAYVAAKKRYLIGYSEGGAGFLLDKSLLYNHTNHISLTFNSILREFGFIGDPLNFWDPVDMPYEICVEQLPKKYMAIHISTGAQSRQWPIENFVTLVTMITKIIPIVVLGMSSDLTMDQKCRFESIPNAISLIGKTSLLQGIDVIRRCTCFVGLESAFSHIAGLLKKPLVGIYSGTTTTTRWAPLSLQTGSMNLIKRRPPCSGARGCGRLECVDNFCMRDITVEDVYELVKNMVSQQVSAHDGH